MSRRDTLNRHRSVECPTCHATPQQPCSFGPKTGKAPARVHLARSRAYRIANPPGRQPGPTSRSVSIRVPASEADRIREALPDLVRNFLAGGGE